MDYKTIIFGACVVGGSVGGSILVGGDSEPTPSVTYVAASTKDDDVAVAQVASIGAPAPRKLCRKQWVRVGDDFAKKWLCDGGHDPRLETWLNNKAGTDGIEIEIAQEETAPGQVTSKATVRTGELPPKPTLPPAIVPDPVEEPVGP